MFTRSQMSAGSRSTFDDTEEGAERHEQGSDVHPSVIRRGPKGGGGTGGASIGGVVWPSMIPTPRTIPEPAAFRLC